ncbi:hypothetical protein M0P98_04170 [bacterium]|nr:hypothetical protein [bacterium]
MDIRRFKKPPSILRPTPFWAINEEITPEETARQMDEMLKVGLGGGFFHSRYGLKTEYMGKEWFDSMKAALDVAKKNDGYLWLYDEDLWPSGNAGGQIAGMKDEYRAASLNAILLAPGENLPLFEEDEQVKFTYIITERNGLILFEYKPVSPEETDSLVGCERLVMVRRYSQKTPWWSGESYVNLLHPEAVKDFIRLTHDVYYKQFGVNFGKRIPGIFTDEPNLIRPATGIPWYEGLPQQYFKWTGRDFWNDLPFLFFDGGQSRHIRLLIHRAILRQFLESYSKPLYMWCEKHGIASTGHYNAEDSFSSQILNHCGGVMSHYRYQHIPGIDHLCRHTAPLLLTCKQASSAARQLGRKYVLTEIFGVSRHTNTFEDFKWIGDYDLVHGATIFCPHLTWYSGKGRRKRDYPPVWNYQQTYWNELPALNDYFVRTAYALTLGKPDVKILLLHSIESAIAGRRIGVESDTNSADIPLQDMSDATTLNELMCKTLDAVLSTGYDCDIGDEGFIEEYGKVENKKFVVGKMSYSIVIVPPSFTWREKTVFALEKFAENGGNLLILGKPPEEIDGIEDKNRWKKLLTLKNVYCLPSSSESVRNVVNALKPCSYSLKDPFDNNIPGTYVQHRIEGKGQEIFFIVNSDRTNGKEYILTIKGKTEKSLLKWDAVEGNVFLATTKKQRGVLTYQFSLPPAGSILLTLSPFVKTVKKEKVLPCLRNAEVVSRTSVFEFERSEKNVLVLDRISVSYDSRVFEKEELEWRVRKNIANHFGTGDALKWQPWVYARKKGSLNRGGDIILRYRFNSDIVRPKSYLVIEDMQKGKVFMNDREISWDDEKQLGWYRDIGFRMVEITDLVKKGENTADFKVHYDFLTEVESAYIVGEFGVEMVSPYEGKIVKEREKIEAGSWVEQGYPFYGGSMVYMTDIALKKGKRVFLKLLNPSGTLFNVRVNGRDAGKILWSPYCIEITSFVKNGNNKIEVELVSSLQNMWGPLHEREGDDNMWVGAIAFENEDYLREEFSFFNYGIGGIDILVL